MGIIKKARRAFRVVRKERVALIFEEVHLQRFFDYYGVDCVFDVGANDGQYAMMLRKKVGYKGDILSFEPIPEAAEHLKKKARSDPRWHVEQAALSGSSGKAAFNIAKDTQFSSLHMPSQKETDLFYDRNKVAQQIYVETSTLKDMYEKYEKLLKFKRPFLKMDTQGNDLEVTRGARDRLAFFVGLQSELSIKKIYEDAPDYASAIAYYNSQGFELSALVPNNEGHFPRLIEIDCIMYNKNFTLRA